VKHQSFSDADIIRIWRNHLDRMEQDEVIKFFCKFCDIVRLGECENALVKKFELSLADLIEILAPMVINRLVKSVPVLGALVQAGLFARDVLEVFNNVQIGAMPNCRSDLIGIPPPPAKIDLPPVPIPIPIPIPIPQPTAGPPTGQLPPPPPPAPFIPDDEPGLPTFITIDDVPRETFLGLTPAQRAALINIFARAGGLIPLGNLANIINVVLAIGAGFGVPPGIPGIGSHTREHIKQTVDDARRDIRRR